MAGGRNSRCGSANPSSRKTPIAWQYPKAEPGDFRNAGTALLTALDERGQEIPGVFATGGAIWLRNMVDFRKGGLIFELGFGATPVTLDEPNKSPRKGFIAFAAGRNKYLPGSLCETEPEVQKFWLSCLDEMIAAGVDGVDFREENHSTHTDFPCEYGFNPVVLERCHGVKGSLEENIARVRGDAYTVEIAMIQNRDEKEVIADLESAREALRMGVVGQIEQPVDRS